MGRGKTPPASRFSTLSPDRRAQPEIGSACGAQAQLGCPEIVGPIKSGLPSLGVPDVHLADFGTLVAGGIGVMLVGFAEGLGAAKTYAAREHQEIDANRELLETTRR